MNVQVVPSEAQQTEIASLLSSEQDTPRSWDTFDPQKVTTGMALD
jgi:hypothetical protein